MPENDLIRQKASRGEIVHNAWMMLGSPFAVELAVSAGWEAVTIDQQHGIGGHAELIACLTAARAGGVTAFVRAAANDPGLIGRALDAGAQGVICPMINSAADARRLVEAVKYPPLGARSFGPYRAKLLAPPEQEAVNGWTIACAQIETAAALERLDEILAVPGLDMIYVGPNDLALSLSNGRHRDIRSPEVLQALDTILAKALKEGVIAGVYANDGDYAKWLAPKGWQVISIGSDITWLSAGAAAALT